MYLDSYFIWDYICDTQLWSELHVTVHVWSVQSVFHIAFFRATAHKSKLLSKVTCTFCSRILDDHFATQKALF